VGGPQAELLRRLAHWMMGEPELEEEALSASAQGMTLTATRRSLEDGPHGVTITRPDGEEVTLDLEERRPAASPPPTRPRMAGSTGCATAIWTRSSCSAPAIRANTRPPSPPTRTSGAADRRQPRRHRADRGRPARPAHRLGRPPGRRARLAGCDPAAGLCHHRVCHGANLEGQPDWQVAGPDGVLPAPPHDETGHTWHHDNGLLFDYTRLGGQSALAMRGITGFRSGMPAFEGSLSDDEIWDVLAYIRSTWPERVQAIQAAQNPPHAD
jgi:hypothetical protein